MTLAGAEPPAKHRAPFLPHLPWNSPDILHFGPDLPFAGRKSDREFDCQTTNREVSDGKTGIKQRSRGDRSHYRRCSIRHHTVSEPDPVFITPRHAHG